MSASIITLEARLPGMRVSPWDTVRPSHATYVRRRLVAMMMLVGVALMVVVAADHVLTDRGGVPASTPAIRSASVSATEAVAAASGAAATAASAGTKYIVRSGDTLWSIAEQFHGSRSVSRYVDTLMAANHGTALQPGQLLVVP